MIIHFTMQSPTDHQSRQSREYTYSATFKGPADVDEDGYIDVDTSDLEWFVRQNNLDILDWEYEGYLPEYEGFEDELYTLLDDVIEEEMVKGIKVKKVERNVDVLPDPYEIKPHQYRFENTYTWHQDYGSDEEEMAKLSFTLVHLDNGYSVLIEDYEGQFSRAELLNKNLRGLGDTYEGISISYPKLRRMGKAKQAIAILPDLVKNYRKSFSDD